MIRLRNGMHSPSFEIPLTDFCPLGSTCVISESTFLVCSFVFPGLPRNAFSHVGGCGTQNGALH